MKVHDLKPPPGSKTSRRRVGRGIAGKGGKTAGRGTKGQGARNNIAPRFEGGQTPLHRRTPKAKGFKEPLPGRVRRREPRHPESLDTGTEVDPGVLRSHGLVASAAWSRSSVRGTPGSTSGAGVERLQGVEVHDDVLDPGRGS